MRVSSVPSRGAVRAYFSVCWYSLWNVNALSFWMHRGTALREDEIAHVRELPLVLPRGQSRAGVGPLLVLAQRWEQVLVGSARIAALPRPWPSAGSPLLGEALEVPVGGRGPVL